MLIMYEMAAAETYLKRRNAKALKTITRIGMVENLWLEVLRVYVVEAAGLFLNPEGGAQKAILDVLLLVVISSLKASP